MNFWKQTNHVMAYFKEENFRGEKRLPSSFMTGFLEVRLGFLLPREEPLLTEHAGPKLRAVATIARVYIPLQALAKKFLKRLEVPSAPM